MINRFLINLLFTFNYFEWQKDKMNYESSPVIYLTSSAKYYGKTAILCRVCLKAKDFFSLVESMVFFVVDGKRSFLLFIVVLFALWYMTLFAGNGWLTGFARNGWLICFLQVRKIGSSGPF